MACERTIRTPMTATTNRPVGLKGRAKVRAADDQRRMVRSENPPHLRLIRPLERPGADRADQKTKTLVEKPLA